MRVLVCGGRGFADRMLLADVMEGFRRSWGIDVLIEGGASGADKMAREWAVHNGVPVLQFAADWKRYGRAAGPMRNQQMLERGKPDIVIAFPGGKGTADMVGRAQRSGLEVMEVP